MTSSAHTVLDSLTAITLTLVILAVPLSATAQQERRYVLATATVGGTFYPVGMALSTLVKVKLRPTNNIDMDAITSDGSNANVQLLQKGGAQFAILSGLAGHQARNGTEAFATMGPQTELRAVTSLWPEAEHFVIRRHYAETGSIDDMNNVKGLPVSLGRENSGTLAQSRLILGALGFDVDRDFELVNLGYSDSAKAIQENRIDAMSTPAGVPVSAVSRAMSALGEELLILEFTDAHLQKVNGGAELWTRYLLEPGTYPGQSMAVATIATLSFLAVRADEDEDAVYQITRAIYENLAFLKSIHKALANMKPETALDGLPVPLHAGARRFYREIGLEIPERLTAENLAAERPTAPIADGRSP